jgi:RNA polymerase sigma-70 factor (ECF subfamily)
MDSVLLESFRIGDRQALEHVYAANVDGVERLVRIGLYRAGRFSEANLSDVVQEAFLRAFSPGARSRFEGTREYAPYLSAIARNALVDWLRTSKREVFDSDALEARIDSTSLDPRDEDLFAPELVAAAARYVMRLAPELGRVHKSRFIRGESQRSAAEELGISRQNLRTLERKLVEGLRRELENTTRRQCPAM